MDEENIKKDKSKKVPTKKVVKSKKETLNKEVKKEIPPKKKIAKEVIKEVKAPKIKKVTNEAKKAKVTKEVIKEVEPIEVKTDVENIVSEEVKPTIIKSKVEIPLIIKEETTEKKRNTFNVIEVIVIMIITALFSAIVGGIVVYLKEDNSTTKIVSSRTDLQELVSTYDEIINQYYGDIDKTKLLEAGIQGMLMYLQDPYSGYMPLEETTSFKEELNGEFVGMGATISYDSEGNIIVMSLFENSPATKAGIQVGDIISKVGEENATGKTVTEVSNQIKRGEIGTKVEIEIIREGKTMDIEITRGKVIIPSVLKEVINQNNKKVGLIIITTFAQNTYTQFKEAYKELEKQGIDSIIVDVRSNAGGHLEVAEDIAKMFLPKNSTIYQLDIKGKVTSEKTKSSGEIKIPVAVLVNQYSASASEILAGALKENIDAKVIGVTTFGKGTMQKVIPLASGASVKYTSGEWLTPNGNKVNGIGIEPTIIVEDSEEYKISVTRENDNQLATALNELCK